MKPTPRILGVGRGFLPLVPGDRKRLKNDPTNVVGGFHLAVWRRFQGDDVPRLWNVSSRSPPPVSADEFLEWTFNHSPVTVGGVNYGTFPGRQANVANAVSGIIEGVIHRSRHEEQIAGRDIRGRYGFAQLALLDGAPRQPDAALAVEPFHQTGTVHDHWRL